MHYELCIVHCALLKLPPVETDVTLSIAETHVEVMNTSSSYNLCTESLVLVNRTSALDSGRTNDGAILTVEAQRYVTS